jgi:Flp pilus assembly protein TadG
MKRFLIPRRRRERGQAMVEFAVTGIVFCIIVFGAVDVGRAVWNYNTLSESVREGGRYAIVHGENSADPSGPGDDAKVTEAVEKFAGGLDTSQLGVQTEWPDGDNGLGDHVNVKGEYTYEPIFGFWGAVSFTLSSSTTMEITY